MKPSLLFRAISLFFTISAAFTIGVSAQSDQARLTGTVTDVNGALIPGASVSVTNERTGEARIVTAKPDGSFLIVALKPSAYTIIATAANFEPLTKKGVTLLVGQGLSLDLALPAKGVAAQVDVVSGEDNVVNTSSASMSVNVNPREIQGLPVNSRQLSQLELQAPGAQNTDTGTFADIRFSGRANQQPGQTEDQIQAIESDRISSTITSGSLLAFPANTAGIIANFNGNPLNRQYQPRAYSPNYTIPERVYQYTFSLQQRLPYNIVSTVAYVGSKGTNLFLRSVANKILPGSASVLNTATAFPTGVGVINRVNSAGQVTGVTTVREFDIVNNAAACGVAAANPVCKPFAEVDYKTSGGDDKYNALQVSLVRNFNTGLTMNMQYTLAKSNGLTAGSNEARTSAQLDNFEADRGRNNFDVRHTFNLSALYELPFGKGRAYNLGKAGNLFLGGWEVGGILNARSGVPVEVLVVRPDTVAVCQQTGGCSWLNASGQTLSVTQGFTANLGTNPSGTAPLPTGFSVVVNTPGGGNSRNIRRPDLIGGVNPYLNNDRSFLNPAAFAIPGAGTFGNFKRNELSGPTSKQLDLVLSKRFYFNEKMNVEFRTEVFNVFNTANFANPSTTLNNALPTLTVPTSGTAYNISSGIEPGQSFTQSSAGSTFGLLRSTVGRTVGLGTNRQIQFAFKFNF
ncbi:MAG: carboxypeptidase-like regulatory domain-containing protein [Pyrinomonadaceae bacterium]